MNNPAKLLDYVNPILSAIELSSGLPGKTHLQMIAHFGAEVRNVVLVDAFDFNTKQRTTLSADLVAFVTQLIRTGQPSDVPDDTDYNYFPFTQELPYYLPLNEICPTPLNCMYAMRPDTPFIATSRSRHDPRFLASSERSRCL
ncbi:unnamed protein product [Dicrocoelium dendriticum]|nr:unnamed protein product [Dicrocoelium dendriticum]